MRVCLLMDKLVSSRVVAVLINLVVPLKILLRNRSLSLVVGNSIH